MCIVFARRAVPIAAVAATVTDLNIMSEHAERAWRMLEARAASDGVLLPLLVSDPIKDHTVFASRDHFTYLIEVYLIEVQEAAAFAACAVQWNSPK